MVLLTIWLVNAVVQMKTIQCAVVSVCVKPPSSPARDKLSVHDSIRASVQVSESPGCLFLLSRSSDHKLGRRGRERWICGSNMTPIASAILKIER